MNNYAFIDEQNLYLSVKDQGWKISRKRFLVYLKEHYGVTAAFLFIGFIKENTKLYNEMQNVGFVCIFKPTFKNKEGKTKGNVDSELILHTMIQYPFFDKAVIVTGDGDFYCLVEYLLKQEKLEIVLIPNKNKYSGLLKRFAKNRIAFISDLRNKVGVK